MNTNYEKELSDWLLSQKENLHVAFEIMNVFPLLRRKILRRFWEQVQDSIQKKLQKESTGWQMLRERGDPFQHDAWFGINVGRPNKQIEALELQFKIEQGLPKDFSLGPFFLYFGVVSTQELTGDKLKRIGSLPEYQNLQKSLMAC